MLLIAVGSSYGGSSPREIKSLAISPDGALLAVGFGDDDETFLYIVRIATGNATRLTKTMQGTESSPSFSPDGKRIAFDYWPGKGERSRIVIVNLDGSNLRQWSPSGAEDLSPVLSPDNKTIVFSRAGYFGSYSPISQPHPHDWDFYASNLDGTNLHMITNESFYMVSPPAVTANGKEMVVVAEGVDSSAHIAIYSTNHPGSPPRTIEPHVPKEVSHKNPILAYPNCLPDGNILFMAADEHLSYDVYRLNPNTEVIEKLTNRNGYATDLKVSADGNTAVFLRWRKNWLGDLKGNEVWLLDLRSGTVRALSITGLN